MCMRHRKPKELLPLDTITMNMGAIDGNTTMNSAYGRNAAFEQDVTGIDELTKFDEEVQYEDVVEVRKAYHENKNEFELSENNAYCHGRAEDVAEYDNDAYEN